jgi:hypothetical protein
MKSHCLLARPLALGAVALVLLCGIGAPRLGADSPAPAGAQLRFSSPEEAVKALAAAAKSGDRAGLDALFGPDVKELLSGDPKQDAIELAAFSRSISLYSHLSRRDSDHFVLNVGAQNWPLPIPIVRTGGTWYFDTQSGKDEVINRRVGEDEGIAIGVCRTYVVAQREYSSEDRDESGVLKFAQQLRSSPQAKDGLYWPVAANEEPSPFGPLVAEARAEGYGGKTVEGKSTPFHGYTFKILTAQGASAPGGAFSYLINGNMIAGFALVAYPAHWGESGVMTFIVNQWGKVYQANLGADSAAIASAMTEFDPDSTWSPVP